MPTAQAAPEWTTEIIQLEEWDRLDDQTVNWTQPPVEIPEPICIDRLQAVSLSLEATLKQAMKIAQLKDDWDGEGSPAYSPITVERAVTFLASYAREMWVAHGIEPPIPRIGPGPDGSVDIHWKEQTWELLVNLPADEREMAVFYGDNYGAQKIRGSLDPRKFNLGIAEWLTQ